MSTVSFLPVLGLSLAIIGVWILVAYIVGCAIGTAFHLNDLAEESEPEQPFDRELLPAWDQQLAEIRHLPVVRR